MKRLFKYELKNFRKKTSSYEDVFSVEVNDDGSIICKRFDIYKIKATNGVFVEEFKLSKKGLKDTIKIVEDYYDQFCEIGGRIDNHTRDRGILSTISLADHSVEVDNIIRTKGELKASQKGYVDLDANLLVNKMMGKMQHMFYRDRFYCWYENYMSLKYDQVKMPILEYCLARVNMYPCNSYVDELIRALYYYDLEIYPFLMEEKDKDVFYTFEDGDQEACEYVALTYPSINEESCNGFDFKKKYTFRKFFAALIKENKATAILINPSRYNEVRIPFDYLVSRLQYIMSKDKFEELCYYNGKCEA